MTEHAGKKVLVTGASKGLGWVAATAFAARGASLFACARSAERLDALKAGLDGPERHTVGAFDLSTLDGVAALADGVLATFGAPDIILHCMGGGYGFHDPLLDWERWELLHRVNLGAAVELNRRLIPAMAEGYVVHVGSTASTEAIGSVAYNTVKAAVAAYVRSLGRSLAGSGVVVTGILPGAFYGPENAFRRLERTKPEVVRTFVEERLPRGRVAEAEEILPLLFLLTGPGASMMAGSCVPIDAGESKAYVTP